MTLRPRVCVLFTDGINCDAETAHAFTLAGGEPCTIHINQLRTGEEKLRDYQVLVVPGGFSYGDDIASGKVLAVEMSLLADQVGEFVDRGGPVLGICNGFQALVRSGVLPIPGPVRATLGGNDSGRFECRWVELRTEPSPCVFTRGLEGQPMTLPVAHGAGRFVTDDATLARMKDERLVTLRYAARGKPTEAYPANPNGSLDAIAGVSDPTGLVFGLMPHPERFVTAHQHPNWRRNDVPAPCGLPFFENAIRQVA